MISRSNGSALRARPRAHPRQQGLRQLLLRRTDAAVCERPRAHPRQQGLRQPLARAQALQRGRARGLIHDNRD